MNNVRFRPRGRRAGAATPAVPSTGRRPRYAAGIVVGSHNHVSYPTYLRDHEARGAAHPALAAGPNVCVSGRAARGSVEAVAKFYRDEAATSSGPSPPTIAAKSNDLTEVMNDAKAKANSYGLLDSLQGPQVSRLGEPKDLKRSAARG